MSIIATMMSRMNFHKKLDEKIDGRVFSVFLKLTKVVNFGNKKLRTIALGGAQNLPLDLYVADDKF